MERKLRQVAIDLAFTDINQDEIDKFVDTIEEACERIHGLEREVAFLRCLEAAGVDNWPGYSEAFRIMEEDYPDEYKEMMND